jgi:signal transduction histidine kinase
MANFEREYSAAIDKVMGADDKLAAAHDEIKRQAAEIQTLKYSRDGFMNGKTEIVRLLKAEQRKTDRFLKRIESLENENEGLRERIAIMEVG